MKKYIIRIAKKNELLYRMAKRFYRSVRPAAPTLYQNYDYVIAYRAKEEQQLSTIFAHYAQIKKRQYTFIDFLGRRTAAAASFDAGTSFDVLSIC